MWKPIGVLYMCILMESVVDSLDNGLALTPPLGWLTWQRFRCNKDCIREPDNCIGEKMIMEMANAMVSGGYRDMGYEYIIIDDCWLADYRSKEGRLQSNPKNFPHGMKALADFVHSKGLKFGLYGDFGTKTCAGFPGSEFYLQLDAQTFADWGVDLVKFDRCNSYPNDVQYGYQIMEFFLNATMRKMVFACEWPVTNLILKTKPDYAAIKKTCNMWRNYDDISDSWDSVSSIIEYWAEDKYNMSSYAGPGGWNDPDEMVIGNFGLSQDQERTHMGMWCMMAAPILMSNDLRKIRDSSRKLLLNKRLLAINQDAMGIQGRPIFMGNPQIWMRPILPKGSQAVAVVNKSQGGSPIKVDYSFSGLQPDWIYDVTEVFDGLNLGRHKSSSSITFTVNPTGIYMFTVKPVSVS